MKGGLSYCFTLIFNISREQHGQYSSLASRAHQTNGTAGSVVIVDRGLDRVLHAILFVVLDHLGGGIGMAGHGQDAFRRPAARDRLGDGRVPQAVGLLVHYCTRTPHIQLPVDSLPVDSINLIRGFHVNIKLPS